VLLDNDLLLDRGFTAAGAVRLVGADIAGSLKCTGAQLTGTDRGGESLVADRMTVAGDIFLDDGFTAVGTVSLRSADVGGSLWFVSAELAEGIDKVALDAAAAQIARKLRWAPSRQVAGLVVLEDAVAGQLEDDWTKDNGTKDDGRASGYWPPTDQGRLRLDGFTYTRIGGERRASPEQRLRWIRGQPKHAASTMRGFATQPYEQLAKVYQQAGQDAEAREVAIARRQDLRRYGDLNRSRKVFNWLLDVTIKYGYRTGRAVVLLVALFVIVVATFWLAQHRTGLIVPTPAATDLRPAPIAARCTSRYPCFSPVGYAIDTVIPLINVHQADYWRPNASAANGRVLIYLTWAGTGLGWTLTTLIVAGYTGLVRNFDSH
jgi:hypothetical protein